MIAVFTELGLTVQQKNKYLPNPIQPYSAEILTRYGNDVTEIAACTTQEGYDAYSVDSIT